MKLLDQSLKYLSFSMLLVLSVWGVIFYFNMLREIKESIDEGLENYKRLIVRKAQTDTAILNNHEFDERFYTIQEISQSHALSAKDRYADTMMYMQDADDEYPELEPVRMLTTAFEHNGRYYELTIVNSMVEEDDLVKELFREGLLLYLLLLASVLVVNNIVLQRLWKPFYDLLQKLKAFRLGNSKEIPKIETRTKEFLDLQQTINTLLQHSMETYEQQKEFIGNASHELQTPLAIATGKLELLLEKGALKDSEAETIAQVLQIIERLTRLNKSLLLLTKIENRQFPHDQVISINDIVQQAIEGLEEIIAFKKLNFSLEGNTPLTVKMDKALAVIIVSNIIKNAVTHTTEKGRIIIDISEHRLTVSNTAHTAALDEEKIFNRFYKSEASSGGTGLGLAIVKAICGLYRFDVSYRLEYNMHCFQIDFSEKTTSPR